MSSNRIKGSQSLQWTTVLFWIVLVGMIASLGVSYLVLKNKILRIAQETSKQEQDLMAWRERNAQLQAAIQVLKSPQELQRRVAGVGLVKVTELQWIPMDVATGTKLARGVRIEGKGP